MKFTSPFFPFVELLGAFGTSASALSTIIAMIGARGGDRLVVVGRAPALAAGLARVTGLNGRTLVVDRGADARIAVERAAARAGTLVEFEDAPAHMLPLDDGSFDVAVLPNLTHVDAALPAIREIMRVLRPAGRIVVLATAPRGGMLGALAKTAAAAVPPDQVQAALRAAGAAATRVLATVDATSFIEGMKRPR